jgi:hypothetical protein
MLQPPSSSSSSPEPEPPLCRPPPGESWRLWRRAFWRGEVGGVLAAPGAAAAAAAATVAAARLNSGLLTPPATAPTAAAPPCRTAQQCQQSASCMGTLTKQCVTLPDVSGACSAAFQGSKHTHVLVTRNTQHVCLINVDHSHGHPVWVCLQGGMPSVQAVCLPVAASSANTLCKCRSSMRQAASATCKAARQLLLPTHLRRGMRSPSLQTTSW